MRLPRIARRPLAASTLLVIAFASACEQKELVNGPRLTGKDTLFASYVALGNSITAGFQSGGILDTTQAESYAALFAHQVGTRYAFPGFRPPGCPPPIVNFQTGARLGGGTPSTCALRDPSSVTMALNNVAVPGAAVIDPTSPLSPNGNPLTTLILGGKTQVQRALDAQPTFVSIWIGNNDVLGPALSGFAFGTPTPVDSFGLRYDAMMAQLTSARKGLTGILFGVVNVTQVPALFPVDSLIADPTFKAEFNAAVTGNPATDVPVSGDCNGAHALVSLEIIAALQSTTPGHPTSVDCATQAPFTLDTVKQAIVSQTVAAYNQHISTAATSAGFAFIDVNPLLAQLRARGLIAARPDFTSATAPFGPVFTLDGFHPSALAQQLIVNAMIAAVNTKYGTAIDTVAHP